MKRKKTLIILAVVLIVLVAAILITKQYKKHEEKINETDEICFTLTPDDVTAVSWTLDSETLNFAKTDDVWADADDDAFPVDQDEIQTLLEIFEEVHATYVIDDVEDYDQYGLKDPSCSITFTVGDETLTMDMGNYSTMDEQRYVSTGDGKVYLLETDPMENMTSERDAFIANDDLTVNEVSEITITNGDTTMDIVYDDVDCYSYADFSDYFLKDGDDYKALSDGLCQTFAGNITGMDETTYATYKATEEDLADYGLDAPALTVTMKGQKYVTVDVSGTSSDDEEETAAETTAASETSDNKEDVEYTISFAEKDDKAYAHVEGSAIVYEISTDTYDTLTAVSYDTLRPTSVLSLDWTAVKSFDVTTDGETYTVTVEQTDDGQTFTLNDTEVDLSTFVDDVDNMIVSEFEDVAQTADPEITMTFQLDNEDYPELTVSLYQNDGDTSYAVFDGENIGYIARSTMADIKEQIVSAALGKAETEAETTSAY